MESLATLETLTDEARFENSIPAETLPGKLLLCHTGPHRHDALPLILSATVRLFGSWVGKGKMTICHEKESPATLEHSQRQGHI